MLARLVIVSLVLAANLVGQQLTVIRHNTESGSATSAGVLQRIKGINGCHLWGFSEVLSDSWAPESRQQRAAERAATLGFRRRAASPSAVPWAVSPARPALRGVRS